MFTSTFDYLKLLFIKKIFTDLFPLSVTVQWIGEIFASWIIVSKFCRYRSYFFEIPCMSISQNLIEGQWYLCQLCKSYQSIIHPSVISAIIVTCNGSAMLSTVLLALRQSSMLRYLEDKSPNYCLRLTIALLHLITPPLFNDICKSGIASFIYIRPQRSRGD